MYFRHLDLFSQFSSLKKIAKAKIMIKCTHALRYEVSHFKQRGKLSSVLFCVLCFFFPQGMHTLGVRETQN